jgi:hypothetical protein
MMALAVKTGRSLDGGIAACLRALMDSAEMVQYDNSRSGSDSGFERSPDTKALIMCRSIALRKVSVKR